MTCGERWRTIWLKAIRSQPFTFTVSLQSSRPRHGVPDSALTLIGQGLAIAEEIGAHLMEPYLHRLRGEILLRGELSESQGDCSGRTQSGKSERRALSAPGACDACWLT